MFYSLHRDRNVLYGGAWFNPDDMEIIEVIDMESAAGDEGVTMLERGGIHVPNEDHLRKALESAGFFHEEGPPSPREGRKFWDPRPWGPPPQPGQLFWTPKPIDGPRIMQAWKTWKDLDAEGGKFEELPEEVQHDVLMAADAILGYSGAEYGGQVFVIDKAQRRSGAKTGSWPGAIYSSNPEKAVWKILKKWGVRRDE